MIGRCERGGEALRPPGDGRSGNWSLVQGQPDKARCRPHPWRPPAARSPVMSRTCSTACHNSMRCPGHGTTRLLPGRGQRGGPRRVGHVQQDPGIEREVADQPRGGVAGQGHDHDIGVKCRIPVGPLEHLRAPGLTACTNCCAASIRRAQTSTCSTPNSWAATSAAAAVPPAR